MAATDLRRRLLDYITRADEKLLREMEAVVENYENDQFVAYSVQGKALDREDFKQEISEAEAEYQKGNYTSQERLKKEMKNWKK